jgi:hypothetical protein
MPLIYVVVLVLPILYAIYLMVYVLEEESFLLHQHHVHSCRLCLVPWVSNNVLNYSNAVS